MSKELKMLLFPLGLLIVIVIILHFFQTHECGQVEYQTLDGTKYSWVCQENKPDNCWSQYNTEDSAIQHCEQH